MPSQSAFAGYGLEEPAACQFLNGATVSQSAFAGYGLEELDEPYEEYFDVLSQSAFAGYGLEEKGNEIAILFVFCRNPLSLDMGWKRMVFNV